MAAPSEWQPQDAEYSLLAFSDLSKSNFLVALFSFERWTYFIVEGVYDNGRCREERFASMP